ncbi:TRAP transporter small permease subunit [Algihabitans albus]|uniref:TRAP transporter small permease subunit n=1 Tax=Algihabitans albus TaxID=2164067 RepID=UPI000E5D7862|nr:TRAP transporter small permease [Algihabitans albus]
MILGRFADLIELGSRSLVWLSGIALIAMAFLITLEALLRKFAGVSLGSVDEIVTYVFAASATCSFGYTLFQRAHIRIEIIRNLLPAPLRTAMDLLAWAAFTAVFSVIAWYAVNLAIASYASGARSVTVLRVPMVWPQGIWAIGLTFTAVAGLAVGLRAYARRSMQPLTPANDVEIELSSVEKHPS